MNSNYLLEEKLSKLLAKFAVPCILALLVLSLYNIVDQIFIGHGVGYLGNGATNVVFPLTIIALGISLFIGDGCAAYMSIMLGNDNREKAEKSVGSAVALIVLASLLLVIVSAFNAESILQKFGATQANIEFARAYYKPILIGLPFFMFANTMNAIIRADGSPQIAMLSMFAGAIFNVIFDAIMIFVLHWGMVGAGMATAYGQVISALISLVYICNMKQLTLKLKHIKLDKIMRNYLPLGVSSLLTQFAIVITMAVMNRTLVYYGALSVYGADMPLTAVGIVMKVFQIIISIVVGVAVGAQPIVGYNLGAGKIDRVKELFKIVMKVELVIGVIATLAFEIFPRQILSIFGAENEVYMSFGTMAFRIFLSMVLLCGIQKATAIFLQSLGRPVLSMSLSLLRDFVLIVPLIIFLPTHLGVAGTLYSAPIADVIAFIFTAFIMRRVMLNPEGKTTSNMGTPAFEH